MYTKFRISECILPLAVVLVIALIVLPLPTDLIDFLLAINFTLSILLLLTGLFVSEPDRFTALPSLLLLSTLFRLGLNISSTRVILGGEASPQVILSFGEVMVGGSLVIGLVIFGIISIIQFLVVAKGSERVAEVAARFTLDALPGKQMSIDADMRAGVLSLSDAREKRRELHRESKLYGALDGAMKFIKGDAIVGICIIFVNIIAGFFLGVFRDELSFMEAVEKYTILTVGDGLVSQIPAVLLSVAAGIVVTRVSARSGGRLSEEISLQLGDEPIALFISGAVLGVMALLPGTPFFTFLFAGMLPVSIAVFRIRARRKSQASPQEFPFSPRVMPALTLRLSPSGARCLQEENKVISYIEALRAEVFEQMGVVVPEVCFDINPFQESTRAELLLHGHPIGECHLRNQNDVVEAGEVSPWTEKVAALVRQELSLVLPELVDDRHTRVLLDVHDGHCADVIEGALHDRIKVTTLTLLLRSLVDEKVSIRDFNKILQGVNEYFEEHGRPEQNSLNALHAAVRVKLSERNIKGLCDQDCLSGISFSSEVEAMVASQLDAGLPPHPKVIEQVRGLVVKELESVEAGSIKNLLCPGAIRLSLAKILRPYRDKLRVIAYEEIPPGYELSITSVIGTKELGYA